MTKRHYLLPRRIKVSERVHPTAKQQKVRPKKPPTTTPQSLRHRKRAKAHRGNLDDVGRQVRSAMEVAGRFYRRAVRGYSKLKRKVLESAKQRRRVPQHVQLQSPLFEKLTNLIPQRCRAKPNDTGQEVLFLQPQNTTAHSWMCAKVFKITPHKESNWIIVKKPWTLKPEENPFLALDVLNVWLKPEGMKAAECTLLPNKGVYTLYCKSFNEYYVGESSDIQARLDDHKRGKGSLWTKRWRGDFVRLNTLTKRTKGTYAAHELKETMAIAKRFCGGSLANIRRESELLPRVRGGGLSLSQ